MAAADIDKIIADFGAAAARARDAGYDGVELHSAHAYTLSSFLSRHNRRRDEYSGRTLEGRLALFGEVMGAVRRAVGRDFPVGVRFLAEEATKGGYTIEDAKLIALRMAQAGIDYISLSVGGKFEDAIHRPGQPLYPYTGYSGDRCMPGNAYPALSHSHLAAAVKRHLNHRGHFIPVMSVGKISDPADAERLLQDGDADIIGMARQLLTDPDWLRKVAENRPDEILRCIYCNVCKQLDENFHEVHCFLWPKGARQAPRQTDATAPQWDSNLGGLAATVEAGTVRLTWSLPAGGKPTGYDVYRAEQDGAVRVIEAIKSAKYADRTILGGLSYRYYVRAFDQSGRAGPPSNTVTVDIDLPATIQALRTEDAHV